MAFAQTRAVVERDPGRCSQIASTLLERMAGFANVGASDPDDERDQQQRPALFPIADRMLAARPKELL